MDGWLVERTDRQIGRTDVQMEKAQSNLKCKRGNKHSQFHAFKYGKRYNGEMENRNIAICKLNTTTHTHALLRTHTHEFTLHMFVYIHLNVHTNLSTR